MRKLLYLRMCQGGFLNFHSLTASCLFKATLLSLLCTALERGLTGCQVGHQTLGGKQ